MPSSTRPPLRGGRKEREGAGGGRREREGERGERKGKGGSSEREDWKGREGKGARKQGGQGKVVKEREVRRNGKGRDCASCQGSAAAWCWREGDPTKTHFFNK